MARCSIIIFQPGYDEIWGDVCFGESCIQRVGDPCIYDTTIPRAEADMPNLMDSSETIQHFEDMGVLEGVLYSASGRVLAIAASATEAYARRCMNDFRETANYFKGSSGIDAVTTDNVPVVMRFIF